MGKWWNGLFSPTEKKAETKGEPDKLPEATELDPDKIFKIAIPIILEVQIGPLETFTERAIVEYDKAVAKLTDLTHNAIFQPMPNGKLRIFAKDETDKKQ